MIGAMRPASISFESMAMSLAIDRQSRRRSIAPILLDSIAHMVNTAGLVSAGRAWRGGGTAEICGGTHMRENDLSDLDAVRGRTTISVSEAAKLLGIGRTAAYEAARRGELPTRRLGRRLVVPVPWLLTWLEGR